MTRKEELEERAENLETQMNSSAQLCSMDILEALLQVERECWRKIIDEIRYRHHTVRMNEKSLEEWCRDQLKEVEG